MKDLKDQLKDWKKAHPKEAAPPPSSSPKKPLPKTLKSSEKGAHGGAVSPAPPPQKSDDELFREAVAGVDQRAVERKYDDAPLPPRKEDPKEEEKLFESFVGAVKK